MIDRRIKYSSSKLSNFCRTRGIAKLALFGSAVTGDFREDSDLDVLVELKPDAKVTLLRFVEMEDDLSELFLGVSSIDLVTLDGLSPYIREDILHLCMVIYEE